MPCYEPPESHNEITSKRVSNLIIIINKKLGIENEENIEKWCNTYHENHCDVVTPLLCSKISNLSEEQLNEIVYNGRDKESRLLADWWDEHKEFDKEHK